MNERCEKIMEEFLQLEKGSRLPLRMTAHLLFCKECRTEVRMLTRAQKLGALPLKERVSPQDRTIQAITRRLFPESRQSPISLANWIISGAAMIVLLLVFVFLTQGTSRQELLLAFYLMFAGIITTYVALFVGCNMDFFVKKIESFKFA